LDSLVTRQLEIVTPVAEYTDSQGPTNTRSDRIASLEGKSVTFLANWKPISTPFMAALSESLADKAGIRVSYSGFPGWRFTHPEMVGAIGPQADRMARECELVVSGVAD
jgi:hypothetical protein